MLIPIITTLTKFVISAIRLAHKNNKHKDAKIVCVNHTYNFCHSDFITDNQNINWNKVCS